MHPAAILVMEAQAGVIPELRNRFPQSKIYLRLEAAGAAWDPLRHGYSGSGYATYAAGVANSNRPDCLVPWNEANIEWSSAYPVPEAEHGYKQTVTFAEEFIRAYRSQTNVSVAFPAFSPGHQEDDFLTAAKAFIEVVKLYDELNLHVYWTREPGSSQSEWFGDRWIRQIAAYEYTGPVNITEFNREWDADDVDRLVTEVDEWVDTMSPQVQYAMWFISSSPDPSFDRLEINNNRTIVEGFARINSEVPPMDYYSVNIDLVEAGALVPGQPIRLVFKVTKPDGSLPGKGIATCTLNTPHGFDEWAYTGEVILRWSEINNGKADEDGIFEFTGTLPDIPDLRDGAKASIRILYVGVDGGNTGTSSKDIELPIVRSVTPPVPVVPSPVESPVRPAGGLSYEVDKHYLFKSLGDIANFADKLKALVIELQAHIVNSANPT